MKVCKTQPWSEFIYGIVYPGFIGSMVYELVDSFTSASSLWPYIQEPVTQVKMLIALYYSLDYMHLYGDMNKFMERGEKYLTGRYLFCDVVVSLLFFFAFATVKFGNYAYAIYFLAPLPALFLLYKYKNKADSKFYPFFIVANLLCVLYFVGVNYTIPPFFHFTALHFLRCFSMFSILVYFFYIAVYYEWKSRPLDEKLYPIIKEDTSKPK